jgi:hypothetical protein
MKKLASLLVMAAIVVLPGCQSTVKYYKTETHNKKWEGCKLQYELNIQTEPMGAKLYIDQEYIGVSPLRHIIQIPYVTVYQKGEQQYYIEESSAGDVQWKHEKVGPATWHDLYPSFESNDVRIDAFKDGYRDASHNIQLKSSDQTVKRAYKGVRPDSDNRIQSVVTIADSVLIRLYPIPESSAAKSKQQQQQQQQQQTVVIGGDNSSAKGVGTVLVRSNTDGADIYVDGMFVGNTPSTLKLTEGVHIVEVRAQGKQTYKRELKVFVNTDVTLKADLR